MSPDRPEHRAHGNHDRVGVGGAGRVSNCRDDGAGPVRLEEELMKIELTDEQVCDLGDLLRAVLGDLSSEIAATDNALYREGLRVRRASLEGVLAQLGRPGE
jgi:hypothetical protein